MAVSLQLQCLLGLQCADFAMIAADQTHSPSIIVMNNELNKLHEITDKMVMGLVGDPGDAAQFAQYVSKNLQLYQMRNNYGLDADAVVHFTRKNLADTLRFGNPSMLNILVAGYDEKFGGQLFSIDLLATCIKVPFAVHGFGGQLCMGILDQYHNYNLTQAQAYDIMKLCVKEIHKRFFFSLPNFQVDVVSKTGIKKMPTINCFSFAQ